MGLRDAWAALRGVAVTNPYSSVEVTWATGDIDALTVDRLWESQPHLRTVVSFLARNIAQLGLQAFERVSDTDRQRLHPADDPVAALLAHPNDHDTIYAVIYRIVADKALHDEAFVLPGQATDGSPTVEVIPAAWCVGRGGKTVLTPDWFDFQTPKGGEPRFRVNASDILWLPGYDPSSLMRGSSPIQSLKLILAEQLEAQNFRRQVWKNAGRVGGYLTRPVGARWDKDTRTQFGRDWNAKFGRDGSSPGGTPVLEDGMEFKRPGFSAHEEEWVEGTKLAFSTVASAYHVNPTMVGVLDNANFSNVREFRRMLYGDTLGPIIADIEGRWNQFLVPVFAETENVYVEFNINEKMQGSFEEQTAAMSSSVGRPWMTANEARARMNLPALDGDADELVTPLNVVVGGLASPRDTAPEPEPGAAAGTIDNIGELRAITTARKVYRAKSETSAERWAPKWESMLRRYFTRQEAVILSRLGSKATPEWWDDARWQKELSDDIFRLSLSSSQLIARQHAVDAGLDPDEYEAAWTTKYLRKMASARAQMINDTTLAQLEAELAGEEPDPSNVFDTARSSRTLSAGGALAASVAGFAISEFGKQYFGTKAEKTWITGGNPRPEHAAMDGETVANADTFSNGARWPGDPILGAEGVAGCNCGLEISY